MLVNGATMEAFRMSIRVYLLSILLVNVLSKPKTYLIEVNEESYESSQDYGYVPKNGGYGDNGNVPNDGDDSNVPKDEGYGDDGNVHNDGSYGDDSNVPKDGGYGDDGNVHKDGGYGHDYRALPKNIPQPQWQKI